MLRASGATRQRGPGLNGNRWSLDQLHPGRVERVRPATILVVRHPYLSYEDRAEKREDERLNEGDEYLEKHDEQRH